MTDEVEPAPEAAQLALTDEEKIADRIAELSDRMLSIPVEYPISRDLVAFLQVHTNAEGGATFETNEIALQLLIAIAELEQRIVAIEKLLGQS